jgi:Mrp family chromosome partitioning ATPase
MQHDPDRVTQFETLHVLGPGLRSQDLVELLASKEMADFLNGAEDLFDHIIIDTPASLLMAEARLLAPQVDGMIVVVGSDVSTFGMLRRCLDTMSETGGSVLGIVMNGLRQTPGGYLRRNLDLFYREGPLPGPPAATEPSIVLVRKQDSNRV